MAGTRPSSAPARDSEAIVRDVLLRDGSTLRLQAPNPEDFEDIKAFYDALSSESLYFRFHGSTRTETVARAEAEASGVDRFALIGRLGGRVVSVASYDGLRERGVAEVAFAVADEHQRRGVGTRMLEQLADIAAESGIHRFDAEVLIQNRPMLGVFEHAGFGVRRRGSGGEVTVSLDITPSEAVRERIGERDHVAAAAALRPFLAPASIAVVGAEAAPSNVGFAVLSNVVRGGFRGIVSPVNRDGSVVCSMLAVRSVRELAHVPELVIVATTGDDLVEIAGEAAACGARGLLVLSAHPEHDGGRALAHDQRLLEILRESGMRMIGPSSFGVLNTAEDVSMNATFSGTNVHAGGLAIGSHAAALELGLLGHAAARGLGVSKFVSLGQRADVSTSDLLESCEEDEGTAAVMLYVETFGDPQRFTRVARRVARVKPILVMRGGRHTESAPAQARSQTAAALRGEAVFDALLREAGVLRFHSGEDLFRAAELFESQPLPPGREIGIVSNSAAAAIVMADACASEGLNVSAASAMQNPHILGLGAGPEDYASAILDLLADAGVDAVLVSYVDHHGGDPEAVLKAISDASVERAKPVVASVVRGDGRLPGRARGTVPNFPFPESCAAAVARAAERRGWLSRPLGECPEFPDVDRTAARALIASVLERAPTGGWLALPELEALLATHGIPFTPAHVCHDVEDAVSAAREIGGPVALKADFASPAHASEIDAMLLGLDGESAVRAGWCELERRVMAAGRQWNGVIAQRLEESGADVLVGAFRDPDLGSVVAVGLGGRQAGLGSSIACRLPPTTDVEADELIDACADVAVQLDRYPGGHPLNRDALRDLVLRFARLLETVPETTEADLNSIRCTSAGCSVLDMRMRIERYARPERVKTW
jgi:acyl-CoA synthetase (NDP forming)/RimJ/RimL family protein N-acetyltransferase